MNVKVEYDGGDGASHRKFTIDADLGEGHTQWAAEVVKHAITVLATHDPATWIVTPPLAELDAPDGRH